MTHAELVNRAERWLRNSLRCKLVIINAKPWSCSEHPDAIGWLPNGESIVVECKVSNGDASADARKPWRFSSKGMGYLKYYLTTESVKWPAYMERGTGLLRLKGNRVVVEREAECRQDRSWSEEICLLLAHVRGRRNFAPAEPAEETPGQASPGRGEEG
jgi:hypothetical protein